MGWCESELHDDDAPGGLMADEGVEIDAHMCRAGQSASGVPAMDEDRFVWLCEEHKPLRSYARTLQEVIVTWNGLCPTCRQDQFILTVNSDDDVHVNCATCETYIGKMPAGTMLHPPLPEPH